MPDTIHPILPAIMGILNATPDSFSDGRPDLDPLTLVEQAETLIRDGADIIDIGGESTRPGATPVPADEECARVIPVIEALARRTRVPISIDTYKASVAERACKVGASIVNDVHGLQGDPDMARVVAEAKARIVITHNRADTDENRDIIADIHDFFTHSIDIATKAGIARDRIILDPGIGFGKTVRQNLDCVRNLGAFLPFGLPLLLGVSRKSFIGKVLDNAVSERLTGTLVANIVGLQRGATILRVHDVRAHREAVTMLKELETP